MFGGASGRQASSLAQIVVDANNVREYQQIQASQRQDFQQLQGAETKNQRYQNVRIVAVYDTDQVPALPAAPRG